MDVPVSSRTASPATASKPLKTLPRVERSRWRIDDPAAVHHRCRRLENDRFRDAGGLVIYTSEPINFSLITNIGARERRRALGDAGQLHLPGLATGIAGSFQHQPAGGLDPRGLLG